MNNTGLMTNRRPLKGSKHIEQRERESEEECGFCFRPSSIVVLSSSALVLYYDL